MGQTLSEPVTEKHTSFGQDDTLVYGISEMQGWRISMEDAHATVLSLDASKTGDEKASFFAVYDGHGGSSAAIFSGRHLHERLAQSAEYKEGQYERALKMAFLGTDEDLKKNADFANDPSGCTAVAALLVAGPSPPDSGSKQEKVARRIIVANAGDSRSVLSVAGEAKAMSYDHKPSNRDENSRIVKAGGFVEFGRVNGNLALSRAIGDFEFKQNLGLSAEEQIVTADPEIISHDVAGEEEFLVLACDGIWDCLSSQQVVDLVRRGVAKGKSMQEICEDAIDRCLAPDSEIGGVGCDNMTICVVALLGGRTKEEWYAWVKERVENKVGWETPEDIAPVFANAGRGAGGAAGGAAGAGGGAAGPMGLGRLGAIGGGSVLSALAGGLAAADEGEQGRGGGIGALRLPGGLAGALGGAGIVFRPGSQQDEEGNLVYEAHLVNDDDSDQDDDEEGGQLGGGGGGGGAQLEELSEDGETAASQAASGVVGGSGPHDGVATPTSTSEGGAAGAAAAATAAAAAKKTPEIVDSPDQTLDSMPQRGESPAVASTTAATEAGATAAGTSSVGAEAAADKAKAGADGGGKVGGSETTSTASAGGAAKADKATQEEEDTEMGEATPTAAS